MNPALQTRIDRIAADRESGASELLGGVVAILRDALEAGEPIQPVAEALCRAQPSMAPVWNAALAASGDNGRERLDRFAQLIARAPQAIARFATTALHDGPLAVVTISFSGSVLHAIEALHTSRPITVACAEGRPALEGRRLASRLAALGIPVTCFSDAAIAHALPGAGAVLVGADAVSPEWFLNKSGTRMLAAAANQQGVPLYVVASRDKFVPQSLAAQLVVREGAAEEIWSDPPAGVTVRNPYFEPTPLDLVTAVISDIGVLGAGMVPDVCRRGGP